MEKENEEGQSEINRKASLPLCDKRESQCMWYEEWEESESKAWYTTIILEVIYFTVKAGQQNRYGGTTEGSIFR